VGHLSEKGKKPTKTAKTNRKIEKTIPTSYIKRRIFFGY
jgi:hypothetical protein